MKEKRKTDEEIEQRIEEQRAEYEVLIRIAQLDPALFLKAENVYNVLETLRWVLGKETNSGRGRGE